ncbi:MAG: AMIN domain-containing protein [Gemmatimonadales bacterium]|nr:AMIN domain-containing protein [Gemmatimonadales bacterium]
MIPLRGTISAALVAAATLAVAPPAWAGDLAPTGEVTAVHVRSLPGQADFVISVRGDVKVSDFMLNGPDRLVLDLEGATLGRGAARLYDGVLRGGIRNVRVAQFRPEVVRVVLDLEAPRVYKLTRDADQVRVTFGVGTAFEDWSSTGATEKLLRAVRQPEVALPAAEARPARAAEAAAEPQQQRTEPRITVTYEKADIADVVASFAQYANRTIVLGKSVAGTVTAEIRDKPWPQAFQAILAAQGLVVQELPGGILRIDNPQAFVVSDSTEPLETRAVRISYSSPLSLARTVETILTRNRGRVIADTSSNSVVVTDLRSRIPQIADFIRSLDIRRPQVSIQAKIIFVNRTDIERLGLRYDLGSRSQFFNQLVQRTDPLTQQPFQPNQNVINLGGNQLSAVANANNPVIGSALDLIFSTSIGGFSLTSFLQAVEQVQLSDVQAEPVITTVANRQADILVGEETPIRVIDAASIGGANAPRATVQFRETGIRLTVNPVVTQDRQIVMDLTTERSNVDELAAADLGFTFRRQRAVNRLIVNDGETAVIGGLTVTEVTRTRSGIPLLSGLPLVGRLFSSSSDTEVRRDLIILVTPRITDDGGPGGTAGAN